MRRISALIATVAITLSGLNSSPVHAIGLYDYVTGTGYVNCSLSGNFLVVNRVITVANCAGNAPIPASVSTISSGAFSSEGSLTSVTRSQSFGNEPDLVLTIESDAFRNSGLTSVNFGSAWVVLEPFAFSGATELITMRIGPNVVVSDATVFRGNTSLTSFDVDVSNRSVSSVLGVLYDQGKTKIMKYPQANQQQSYTIPAAVTSIDTYAFSGATYLKQVNFEARNLVLTIGDDAFSGASSLESITIPESVSSIGAYAFSGTTSLKSVVMATRGFPLTIGDSAFSGATSLTEVTLPNGVSVIGNRAFSGATALKSLTIPSTISSIGFLAFEGTSALTAINVDPLSLNFSSASGVLFDRDKTNLIQYPLGKLNSSYTVPSSVFFIQFNAFAGSTHLESVSFEPQSRLVSIGNEAFQGATALKAVTIPANVNSIGLRAFMNTPLEKVKFLGNPPVLYSDAFTSGPRAYVKSTSSFGPDGSNWAGLTVWHAHSVVYDTNDGEFPFEDLFLSGETVSILGQFRALTYQGYTFSGWNTNVVGSGTSFSPGDTFIMGTSTVTLFPKWVIAAANSLKAKKKYAAKSLAKTVGVRIVSPKATLSFKVSSASRKICTKSGSKLKTLKAGKCIVTFTVQEPKPKKGKKPKATKTVKTLVVK